MRLGIDFGTTRTVVAYCDRGNYPILTFVPEEGDALDGYPSLVAERDGELRFGLEALAVESDPSFIVVRSFKRLLGESDARPDRIVRIGSLELPVLELLVRFLVALREAIRERSNLPRAIARDKEMIAVVATPANALGTQRFLTLEAFRRAGFTVAATLNEPSAAGFEYTHRYRNTLTARREHIVVYDLGGGTFDASLVHLRGRSHDVITTAGLHRLGGDDFDTVLVELALTAAGLDRDALDPRALARLEGQCRDAKERLHPSSRRMVFDLDYVLADGAAREVTVATAAYYEACAPLVERTIEAMLPVMERLDHDVKDAHEGNEDSISAMLAGIYVVGGASALPVVGRILRERFGRKVHRSTYPSAATAVGLAIACDPDAGFELTDRFARSFGVFRETTAGRDVAFDPIFTRDTAVPGEGAIVTSTRTYRAAHNIGHYRFVECATVDAAGLPQGDVTLFADVFFPFERSLQATDAPPDLRAVAVHRLPGEGAPVRETYTLDAHGIVQLTIADLETGHVREYRIGA
ncbi:MAG: Hsp70 family protein [Polyangiales bacterium]